MSEIRVVRKGFRCLRCGYEWFPKSKTDDNHVPVKCAKCRSIYWNKPKVRHRRVKGQPTEKDVKRIAKQLRPQTQIVREELKETREKERGKEKRKREGKGDVRNRRDDSD